jgi:hypothetical protein
MEFVEKMIFQNFSPGNSIFSQHFFFLGGGEFSAEFSPQFSPEKMYEKSAPGVNPTIVSYNASAVKSYNATSSLVRFENKNI